ncbi:carbohydrate ABC transporter permease [Clostridium algidicarnis]|uniref:carbohydrate ABC transporter permease n=1 Tax=Clostridium algidicarnis TaxID=37659 RepID=UPI001C0CC97D|nr:sugar ABC transporter permease [Clostridium algidicarnis]MBU3196664.1 sugar ABC transporter permease [Clostridium algidicarnis]MBU3210016.1 sugar ABC transporter permease [Clostridium algidicarnis]MBU3227727.1 sugar ABC transporter permease [Clostridium algidicarnis]MBU3251479.1 sugar ABC transporter permease [Clostridium algidicarnis]
MIKLKNKKDKSKVILFLVPALLIYIVFLILPMFGAIYFSTADWKGIMGTPINFVGLKNYISVFKDPAFMLSLKNMTKMVFFSVLFHTPIALLLAVAINTKCRGYRFFKVMYFIPTIFPLTAVGLLWYFIFMPNGSLNKILELMGFMNLAKGWLINPATAMNTIIFVNIWAGIGYYMVILMAGLTTIPEEVYEAASIDGATSFKKFFHITIPMLKPILSMCILMDIIGSIKVFDLIFVMTEGGPNGLTNLPTTLMYYQAFRYDNYGVGSAIGVIILVIALILTIGSNFIMDKRKQYEEGK